MLKRANFIFKLNETEINDMVDITYSTTYKYYWYLLVTYW